MLKKKSNVFLILSGMLLFASFVFAKKYTYIIVHKDPQFQINDFVTKIIQNGNNTYWEVGDWGNTQYNNGQCYQIREVVCKTQDNKVVDDKYCVPPKPDMIQYLNNCYKRLEITNRSSTMALVDYQVKITFNPSSDPFFNDCGSNGENLGIWTENESTNLSIWIEKWSANEAIVWVKVNNIPINQKKIYHLYCDAYKAGLSNPSSVFDFYDNFETWSGWHTYLNGIVVKSSDYKYQGSYSAFKNGYCDPSGANKELNITLDYPFILEYWALKSSLVGCSCIRLGVLDNNNNGYGPVGCYSDTSVNLGFDKRVSYNGGYQNTVSASFSLKEWYFYQYIWNNGQHILKYYDKLGNLIAQNQFNDNTYNVFNKIYIAGGQNYYMG